MRLPNKPQPINLMRGTSKSCLAEFPRELTDVERAVIKVIRFRFTIFKRKFGRIPGRREPLFFDDRYPSPFQAAPDQVLSQIREAALAEQVDEESILAYLRL
jgi:hypothetical protein